MKRGLVLLAGALAAVAVTGWQGTRSDPAPACARPAIESPAPPPEALSSQSPAPEPAAEPAADDRDGVGPCPPPYASIPVVRSGRDAQGRPTWWHEDGSCTMRVVQVARQGDETYEIPAVVHLRPLPRR